MGCWACSACARETRCSWRSTRRKKESDMRNRRGGPVRCLVALAAAFMLATAAQAQQPQRLTLNFANTEIDAVVRAMADFTGRTFIVDPRVKGTITLNIEQPVSAE